jgi:hypothetical protein
MKLRIERGDERGDLEEGRKRLEGERDKRRI